MGKLKQKARQVPLAGQYPTNPFARRHDLVTGADRYSTALDTRSKVRIALISLPGLSPNGSPRRIEFGSQAVDIDKDYLYWEAHVEGVRAAARRSSTMVKAVRDHANVDVICFNELGFPADKHGPRIPTLNHLRRLASQQKQLIVAGSYHCPGSGYNACRVFYPDCGSLGEVYKKQVSAVSKSVRERINIPTMRRVLTVRAFGLRLSLIHI